MVRGPTCLYDLRVFCITFVLDHCLLDHCREGVGPRCNIFGV